MKKAEKKRGGQGRRAEYRGVTDARGKEYAWLQPKPFADFSRMPRSKGLLKRGTGAEGRRRGW